LANHRPPALEELLQRLEDDRAIRDCEAFVDIYRGVRCAPGIFDIHHRANGIIEFDGERRATGRCLVFFHNINLTAPLAGTSRWMPKGG
jgi:hypothetical protein